MPIALSLAGLAMNPLLDPDHAPTDRADASSRSAAAAEALARQFAQIEAPLRAALQTVERFTWQTMEVIFAQDVFWERCIPLLDADELKKLRSAVRALADYAGLLLKHDFDTETCVREISSARSAGLLTLPGVSIRELAAKTVETGRFDELVPINEMRWISAAGLAKEMDRAGYRELGFALRWNKPNKWAQPGNSQIGYREVSQAVQLDEIEMPLICLVAEYFFRQAVAIEPTLRAAFVSAKLEQKTTPIDTHFEIIAPFLRKEFERIEAILLSLQQVPAGSILPALDPRIEQHRIGKQYGDLYTDLADLFDKIGLALGAIRRSDQALFKKDTDGQLIQELLTCYREIPAAERNDRVALRNIVGRFRYLTGDYAPALGEFTANAERLSDPLAKGETLFNAYQCALMQSDWSKALEYLFGAVKCAPRQFIPFPLGKYPINRILGISTAGVVFSCETHSPKAKVLIKTLGDADEPERIVKEIKALAGKDLPGVVKVLECAYVDAARRAGPYVVLEAITGKSLEEYVREKGPLQPADVADLGIELSRTLHALHRQDLIHRNLSPKSVYVAEVLDEKTGRNHWEVQVADVAFAPRKWPKPISGTERSLTDPMEFAPPEQRGEIRISELTPASDIHALARVCCYALFQTPDPSDKDLDRLPRILSNLLLDCLEEEPHRRPSDCLVLQRRWEKVKASDDLMAAPAARRNTGRAASERDAREDDLPKASPFSGMKSTRRAAEDDNDDDDLPRRRPLSAVPTDRLQRRGREDDADDSVSSSKMGILIGGLIAILIAGGGLLYLFVFKKSEKPPSPAPTTEVAQQDNTSPAPNLSADPFPPKKGGQEFDKPSRPDESSQKEPAKKEPPKKVIAPPVQESPKKDTPKTLDKPTEVLAEAGTSYLSDREAFDVRDGAWPLGKGGRLGNPLDASERIRINGIDVPKGLSMTPNGLRSASAKYRIDQQATRFFTEIALNDKTQLDKRGQATFEVFGDGNLLWTSEPLRERGKIVKCDLNISTIAVLELRTSAEGSEHAVQAVWVNPKLNLKSEMMPKKEEALVKDDPEQVKGKKIFLTFMKAHEVVDGMWPVARQGRIGIGEKEKFNAPIKVRGMIAKEGVSMHPGNGAPAKLSFQVKKGAKSFVAEVAMDDSAFIARPAVFEVYGDGKLLFLSDEINKNTKPQKVSLDVSKYDVVELTTKMADNGGGEDCRAVWIDPYFIWDDAKPLPQQQIYLAELPPFDPKGGFKDWNIVFGKLGDVNAPVDLSLDDKPSKKGICMHPGLKAGTSIKFPLNRKYARLIGRVGLNDTAELTPPKGSVTFDIAVDEKVVWTSKPVKKSRTFEEFDIDLEGAGVIQIRTRATGSVTGLHAIWIDPILILANPKVSK